MSENEVIIVDSIPQIEYDLLIEECVNYAIISLPFTVDRMNLANPVLQALNIAKGKIAERIFEFFCNGNGLNLDFDSCSTAFWCTDKRDFLFGGMEWDLKNNFVYCTNSLLTNRYIDLPALIPDRFSPTLNNPQKMDQWHKRNHKQFACSAGVGFIFTFMKGATLINGNRGLYFLEIKLSKKQLEFIENLYREFGGRPQTNEPFTQTWFWGEMANYGPANYYKINFRPALVITGYAKNAHWYLFKKTGPLDYQNNYQDYLNHKWYNKNYTGSLNFLNGALWSTITNATTPIVYLPSFLLLFPQLLTNIQFGRIKSPEPNYLTK